MWGCVCGGCVCVFCVFHVKPSSCTCCFWSNDYAKFAIYAVLRGTAPATPKSSKISMFCALSQNFQFFSEKWYMHVIVNCPRNSKIASKFRYPKQFLSYWSKINILTVLVYNLKLALLKFQCHFWVPWTISHKMHYLFSKKLLIILREHITC